MKKYIVMLSMVTASAMVIMSCGKKAEKDAKAVAEGQNDAKFQKTDLEKDTEFAVNAADDGMLEVQLGKLAVDHGFLREVKELGQKMVDDHGKCNNELKSMADKKNISLPAALSDHSRKTYEEFTKKSSSEFDKDYTKLMVSAHKKAIDAFRQEATTGADTDLKDWASGIVPALEHHLAMSEDAEKVVKNTNVK